MAVKSGRRRVIEIRNRHFDAVSEQENQIQDLLDVNRSLLDEYAEASGCRIADEVPQLSVIEKE